MRMLRMALTAVLAAGFGSPVLADNFRFGQGNGPEIELWTNKGYDARYYYGEDVAVFFRAEQDCYVVVYDIDPSGAVTVLFPSNYYNSAYATGGKVYRIPDYYSDYTLEVSGESGTEHIFAVATYEYLEPPDFIRYIGYDYGDPEYYDDSYFVNYMRGDLDEFVRYINHRFTKGPYSVAYTRFYVDSSYRHHQRYRYWDYDPYYVGSAWIGCNYPGAEIWIDGIYYGLAPVLIPRIWFGYHWVWAYYGGYPCYQRYFYVTSYERYYIDVRIDNSYKDYRYRRNSFRDWRPLEKNYRNEDGFAKMAREARIKKVERRELPSHVVRDFHKRGLLKENSPLVKRAVDNTRTRDAVRLTEKRQKRSEIDDPVIEKRERRIVESSAGRNLTERDSRAVQREPGEVYRPIVPEKPKRREAESRIEKRENERSISTKRERSEDRIGDRQSGREDSGRDKSQEPKYRSKSTGSEKPAKSSVRNTKPERTSRGSSTRKGKR